MHECLPVCQASSTDTHTLYMYLPMSMTAAPFLTICPFIRPGMPEGEREGGREGMSEERKKRKIVHVHVLYLTPTTKKKTHQHRLLPFLPLPILLFLPPPPPPQLTSSHYHYVCHLCHHRQLLRGRVPVTVEIKQPSSAYMHECVRAHVQKYMLGLWRSLREVI